MFVVRRSRFPASERGVALVITLILLSVTLVMALAFLAISGHERGSVTTQTDTATTRLAADAGLAAAEAQIVANILSTDNPYSFGLIVSTNYINPDGFQSGVANPNNVSYVSSITGLPLNNLSPNYDFLQNLGNLLYNPRPPVFIPQNGTNDFRYYLDLNRNGRAEPNGWVAVVDNTGKTNGFVSFEVGDPEWIGVLERPDQPYGPNNHFIARYAFIALPVGNSLDLNAIHNQVLNERFSGATLFPNSAGDVFLRNQGVGTWELNLAAFLADLNTNRWNAGPSGGIYQYNQARFPIPGQNFGAAFEDARALIAYRYANNYSTLKSVDNLFGGPAGLGDIAFRSDRIDGYGDGPLQTGFSSPGDFVLPIANDNPALPWAGADNTNRFFDLTADLFGLTKNAVTAQQINADVAFTNRLTSAGTSNSTYNRYTFYRMLSQLGTDTAPESGKMNLNYDNLVQTNLISGAVSATNFIPWTPLGFFTNAADRMLRAYSAQWATAYRKDFGDTELNPAFVATFNVTNAFGVTDIPVWVSNRFVYSPAVQRVLQLAANMYDATTTNFYPDIFRPVFTVTNGNVFITGYVELPPPAIHPFVEANGLSDTNLAAPIEVTALSGQNVLTNVYGVPWIISAKKGFPNFNEFSIESAFQLTRKLEVARDTNAVPQPHITLTNQMYLMNITNYFGVECWNSYRSNYYGAGTVNPGRVDILVRCSSTITLTNDDNMAPYSFATNFAFKQAITPPTTIWPGWNGGGAQQVGAPSSFMIPLNTSILALTNAVYYYNEPNPPNPSYFYNVATNYQNYQDKGIRPLPHFGLLATNRLQVVIIDYSQGTDKGQIIDYVQLGGLDSSRLLNSELPETDANSLWNTNYYPDYNGFLLGVYNQIQVSKIGTTVSGDAPTGSGVWTTGQIPGGPANNTSPAAQQAFFNAFFSQDGHYNYPSQSGPSYYNTETSIQAPYTPTVFGVQYLTWQANDPLVHYLTSDLTSLARGAGLGQPFAPLTSKNLGIVNNRYKPWGQDLSENGVDTNPRNPAFKDPLAYESSDWDFPAGKLPTVGWLGRVHRGTPWQTVYLKSTNILNWANNSVGQNGYNTWQNWTGNGKLFDAINTAPVEDRLLFDLFSTAFNDNTTRGQLSVNISSNSPAAWSALFSGVVVLANTNVLSAKEKNRQLLWPRPLLPVVLTNIQPAGVNGNNSALAQIVTNIDAVRATFTNADGLVGAFEHKGDILAVPALTDQSPFLNRAGTGIGGIQLTNANDEMYEWLPQQVMSLLRVGTARYVIYSYGQALKPAPNGTYLGATPAGMFGMVTNYQVVSEIATRAVVRLDTVRTNAFIGTNATTTVTSPRAVIESFNILPPD